MSEIMWFGHTRYGVNVRDVLHRAFIRSGYTEHGTLYTLENPDTGLIESHGWIVWRPWKGWGLKTQKLI